MRKNWVRKDLMSLVTAAGAFLCALLLCTPPGHAFSFEMGQVSGGLDITLGYGGAVRLESAPDYMDLGGTYVNTEHPAASNTKSDMEFGSRELVSNVFRAMAELDLKYEEYGLKTTASYSYDTQIMNRDRSLTADPTYGAPFPQKGWSDEAEDNSGSVFELLDSYVYGTFGSLDLRVGKQVINWGEGLFFMDGVSTQAPLNINKLVLPGSELKEAYMGIGGVRAMVSVTDKFALDSYMQWEWDKNKFPGAGTFYGEDYLAAPGAEEESAFLVGPAHDAKSHGQWGISGRYFVGDYEFGLYFSRYHDSMPMAGLNPETGLVYEYFAENQNMFGASISTTMGDWSVNAEVSYRPDRTVGSTVFGGTNGIGLNDDGQYWTEADTASASIHGLWLGGPLIAGIDSQFVKLQLGMDYINYDKSNADLQPMVSNHDCVYYDEYGIAHVVSGEEVTTTSWGLAAGWDGTWMAVLPTLDITLALFAQYDFSGNSHMWGNFSEGRLLTSATLTANYGSSIEYSITYARMDFDESNYENQDTINFEINYKF